MNDIRIILAETMEQLERHLKIRKAVFTVEKNVPKDIEVDEYDRLGACCNHFLIQYHHYDVGAVRCLHTTKGIIRIQRFCFLKEYRGLGLGKITMNYIEDYYRQKGKTTVEMDAKYEVCRFYEKCGYKRISDVFTEAGIPHITMIKKL